MTLPQTALDPPVVLQTAMTLAELTSPETIDKLCDNLFADLKMLCTESAPRGMDSIEQMFNYPGSTKLYVTSSNWMPPQGPRDWYHGFYVGIGIDPPGRHGLGFLTDHVVAELQRRLMEQQTRIFAPEARSVRSVGGTIWVNDTTFQTPDGTFQLSHSRFWILSRRTW